MYGTSKILISFINSVGSVYLFEVLIRNTYLANRYYEYLFAKAKETLIKAYSKKPAIAGCLAYKKAPDFRGFAFITDRIFF